MLLLSFGCQVMSNCSLLCYGILQGKIQVWVANSSSRGSPWPRDCTHISASPALLQILYHWATRRTLIVQYLKYLSDLHFSSFFFFHFGFIVSMLGDCLSVWWLPAVNSYLRMEEWSVPIYNSQDLEAKQMFLMNG